MTSDSPIHVDEDYKAQVEREKAAAQPPAAAAAQPAAADRQQLPPANLSTLLISLYSQTMFALGFIPHPETGETSVRLDEAKHLIDTLTMLEEKTHGNRTPDEIKLLSRLLHEVRLAYVEAEKRPTG